MLYIIARSIHQGRTAGLVSTLGLEVGTLLQVIAAALGISALLASSTLAFNVVKYLGAAYLIYLGIGKLLVREEINQAEVDENLNLKRIFLQGVLVNLLNPKTSLFFLAFLPQFVDPSQGAVALQILFLGFLFVTMATISDGLYALVAGTLGQLLRGNLCFLRTQRYFAGSVYIGLGVSTVLSGSNNNK
ncbi:putative threonine efflux protein [Pleurocapsa sp. PCC 7327]|uniref:LysE family translocator n=1 Tax=Pleurocapsa sp. PCC 7327 TaxID=118163 RepID=UPI00029F8F36|nr:putative threonine efflux protein [Pleurocapsa sp. PCC 7327]